MEAEAGGRHVVRRQENGFLLLVVECDFCEGPCLHPGFHLSSQNFSEVTLAQLNYRDREQCAEACASWPSPGQEACHEVDSPAWVP